jgi:plasmid stabilization system protein ParE
MAFPYKMHQLAYEEYISAYAWYENEKKGLGEKFIDAVDKRVERICEHPEYYSYTHGTYRQAAIEGFPFAIVYKFYPKRKLVHISSIHHTSRHPRTKFRREQ